MFSLCSPRHEQCILNDAQCDAPMAGRKKGETNFVEINQPEAVVRQIKQISFLLFSFYLCATRQPFASRAVSSKEIERQLSQAVVSLRANKQRVILTHSISRLCLVGVLKEEIR